jgi:phosphoribosylaminoimidazole-succinocarboxamide synthase
MVYEGKTKIVEIKDGYAYLHFKDDITAGDGEKHDVMSGKGSMCAEITARLMRALKDRGIDNQFVEFTAPNVIKAIPLKMYPLEVVVRFKKAGSFIRRYGGVEGEEFAEPLVEFFVKDDERHDPMVCKKHLPILGIASLDDAEEMERQAKEIALALRDIFKEMGYDLWDMKFEFGKAEDGKILLGDEISPDTLRLRRSGEIFDKDVYRRNLGDPMAKYKEVLEQCRKHIAL